MPTCIISSLFPIQVRASDDALKFFLWWWLFCLSILYKVVISRWGGAPIGILIIFTRSTSRRVRTDRQQSANR